MPRPDAHSIRSVVPRLFSGKLPDLNLGSNGGASADAGLGRNLRSGYKRMIFNNNQRMPGCETRHSNYLPAALWLIPVARQGERHQQGHPI